MVTPAPSFSLPLPDAFSPAATSDLPSPLSGTPTGTAATSKDLLATLDPYGGDVAAWLNDLLDPADDEGGVSLAGDELDLEAADHKVRTLLGRLSGLAQDTSQQLEGTIHEISRTVPRLAYDLQFMRESATGLRGSLHAIEGQAPGSVSARFAPEDDGGEEAGEYEQSRAKNGRPDQKTTAVLERLEYLDTVKTGMEATLAVLQEAESWTTLEPEITALLGQAQHLDAARRLAESSKFVTLFTPATAEYETRRALLVSLQNQLEASLSTALVGAVGARDRDACRRYWDIFGMIQREDEFRGYYYGARRAALVQEWAEAVLIDGGEQAAVLKTELVGGGSDGEQQQQQQQRPSVLFSDFLAASFFPALKALVQEEAAFLPAVFPDPPQTLTALLQSILDNLNPSFAQRLEAVAEHHGAAALSELIKSYKATGQAAAFIQTTMDKLTAAPKPPNSPVMRSPAAGAGHHPHGRRDSRRLSAYSISIPRGGSIGSFDGSSAAGGHSVEPGLWEAALYEPFLALQAEYTALERRYVLAQLDLPAYTPSAPASGGGEGTGDLARAVWEKWAAVLDLLEGSAQRALDFTHGYGATGLVKVANEAASFFLARTGKLVQARTARSKPVKPKADDADELDELNYDGMDYTSEDLALFQLALHLLGTCRTMRDRLTAFEAGLVKTLSTAAARFLADKEEPNKAAPALEGSTRGAVGILQQSTLNSKELHDLFDLLHVPAPSKEAPSGRPSLPGHASSSSFTGHHLRTPSFFPTSTGAGGSSPSLSSGHAHSSPSFSSSAFPPPATRPPPPLLDPARAALGDFVVLTQSFLQQTILAPLLQLLSTYPSLSVFRTTAGSGRSTPRAGGAQRTLANVPTFSLSPTETISRVGEGLLNLPRLFEVYAVDDALSFSIETLPHIASSLLAATGTATPSPSTLQQSGTVSPSDRSPLSSPALPPASAAAPKPPTDLSAERVTALHLQSLTSTLLAHLLHTTLAAFPVLSPSGAEQLATDLGYLGNVVRSVDVDWKEGDELAALLGKDEGELRAPAQGAEASAELVRRARVLRGLGSSEGLLAP